MDATNAASLCVSAIAILTAFASQRAASKASTTNARTAAEEEAYTRARAFDLATIARQDAELEDCREHIKGLEDQVEILRWRLNRAEAGLPPMPYPKEKPDG